jgi:hypothetical protein
MASQIDAERVKRYIRDALRAIQTEADPRVLQEYRSLIKKEVSLFRRSYLSAYLLMRLDRGGKAEPEGRGKGSRRTARPAAAGTPRGESPRYPLADEESVRLFVSIGRSRRIFPREILGLINTKTAIPKEDIGAIRILENYSFVQVRTTVADKIIEALNGCSFRGKVLSVNYARNRREDLPAEEPGADPEYRPEADRAVPPDEAADRDFPLEEADPEEQFPEEELTQEDDDHPDKEEI